MVSYWEMDLNTYRKTHGVSCAFLAKRTGCNQTVMGYFFRGERRPSILMALAIEVAAEGYVPATNWYTPQEIQAYKDKLK